MYCNLKASALSNLISMTPEPFKRFWFSTVLTILSFLLTEHPSALVYLLCTKILTPPTPTTFLNFTLDNFFLVTLDLSHFDWFSWCRNPWTLVAVTTDQASLLQHSNRSSLQSRLCQMLSMPSLTRPLVCTQPITLLTHTQPRQQEFNNKCKSKVILD